MQVQDVDTRIIEVLGALLGDTTLVGVGSPAPTEAGAGNGLVTGSGSSLGAFANRATAIGQNVVVDGSRGAGLGWDLLIANLAFDCMNQGRQNIIGDGVGFCSEVQTLGRNLTALEARRCYLSGRFIDVTRTNTSRAQGFGHTLIDCDGIDCSGDSNFSNTFSSRVHGLSSDMRAPWSTSFGAQLFTEGLAGKSLNVGYGNQIFDADACLTLGFDCESDGAHNIAQGNRAHARTDNQRAFSSTRRGGLGADQVSLQPEYFATLNAAPIVVHKLRIAPDSTAVVRAWVAMHNTASSRSAGLKTAEFTVRRAVDGVPVILDTGAGGPIAAPIPTTSTGHSGGAAANYDAEVDVSAADPTIGPDAGTGFEFTANTVIRNDGGDWLADGLRKRDLVTIASAEDGGNNGIVEVTDVTAGVVTFGFASFTPNAADTAVTFNNIVNSIALKATGDATDPVDGEIFWSYVEVGGRA